MDFLKKVWVTFRQLKTWMQVVLVFVLLGIIGSIGGSGSNTSSQSTSTSNTGSATASSASTPSAQPTPTKAAVSSVDLKAAMAHIRVKTDKVKNTKYYRDLSSPNYVNQNGFDIYAGGTAGTTPNLYLEIQYEGSDWLFIKSYFFNVDGFTYELTPDYGVIKTDNDTNVWEWYNEPIDTDQIDLIQKIIKSKSAVMRLNGSQYYKDVTITATQKAALQHVLTVFQGLGGDLTNP